MRKKCFKFCALTVVGALLLGGQSARAAGFTLEDLLYQAMQSYPTILAKQSQKDAAQGDLTAAKLKFLPNPSFNTQRNQVHFDGPTGVNNLPATNVTVSQPIWMGGGLVAGYNKADARLSAADYGLLESREDISKRLISSYTEWLKSYLKVSAFEENVKVHERFVSMIDRRYDAGVASGADKDLGYARLHQARSELDTQRSIEQSSLESLSQLVGQPISRMDLAAHIARGVSLPKRKEGIDKALAISPTIQRYKYEADAAEAEAKEIRSQALPQVSFQAQRQIGNAYYPAAQGFNTYGVVVNYAPGGGFSSIATASAAMDRAKAATMQIDVSKRDLADKLSAEYNEYEFNLQKREALRRSADLSSDISNSYDRQYLVGRKSWLDLMNAVRERAQQYAALADAEGSVLGSSRRLLVYIDGTSNFDVKKTPVLDADQPTLARKPSNILSMKSQEVAEESRTSGSLAGAVVNGKTIKPKTNDLDDETPSRATQMMRDGKGSELTTATASAKENGKNKKSALSAKKGANVAAQSKAHSQGKSSGSHASAAKPAKNANTVKIASAKQAATQKNAN